MKSIFGRCTFYGAALPLAVLAGCTIHPAGEKQERDLASSEGKPYVDPVGRRAMAPLPDNPTPDELVRYADLASPELEEKYWEWRSAIEQIPQDGTQATNLVVYGNVPITRGSTAFNRTVVTVANDPMADIQWPSKPAKAAERALKKARAAGLRFQQSKLQLRQKVLGAFYDYALAAELERRGQINAQLLAVLANVADAEISSGRSTQASVLGLQNDLASSTNQVIALRSRLPGLRAAVNAAIGRDPAATLSPPQSLPVMREIVADPAALLEQITANNPGLAALDADVRAREREIELARLQYLPDFSLSASTDLGGIAQNLSGMITVPLLRYQAINAAIAQAEANLRGTRANRSQSGLDLRSRLIGDVAAAYDLRRQLKLLQTTLIPRADSIRVVDQSAYETGRISLAELIASEKSANDFRRMETEFHVAYEQRLLDVETVVGKPLPASPKP